MVSSLNFSWKKKKKNPQNNLLSYGNLKLHCSLSKKLKTKSTLLLILVNNLWEEIMSLVS